MSYLDTAILIAGQAFSDKKDLAGNPYFTHLKRVKDNLVESWRNADDYVLASAILHDILEDCPEWNEKALKQVFNDSIIDVVVILTKLPKENYDDYIQRIIDSGSYPAIQIKLADLTDNMDITRLPEIKEKDAQRLNKYLKAYKRLKEI